MTELGATEAVNERTRELDRMPLLEMLQVINDEDAKVAVAIRKCLPHVAQLVELFTETVKSGGRVWFVGAGTSGRLGLMEAAECPPTFGVPRDLIQGIMAGGGVAAQSAREGAEDDERAGWEDLRVAGVKQGDLVIGLSASGKTPYVLAALAAGRGIGAHSAAIVCNPTDLADSVDVVVTAVVGPEVVSGSTRMKAGTAQKMILNMVTTASMVRLGRIYGNLMLDMKPSNRKLRGRAERIVVQATGVDEQQAAVALSQAGGATKVAILSILGGITPDDARRLLDKTDGHIQAALDQGSVPAQRDTRDGAQGRGTT